MKTGKEAADGLVRPIYGDMDWRHAFDRGALDDLLARLLIEAEPVEDTADGVGITEAADLCSCAPVEIVHLLLRGEVSWRGRWTTRGVACLLVRPDAIRALLEKQGMPGPTVREAVVETEVKREVIASLIAMGAMTTGAAVDALTRSPVTVIHQTSLKGFFENYVELDDIASEVGRDAFEITKFLNINGVVPIFRDSKLRMQYFRYSDICIHFDKLNPNNDGFRRQDIAINWHKR